MDRDTFEGWYRRAIAACDPANTVRISLRWKPVTATVGIAIGTSALAMACGAGPIARGVAVTHVDDGRELPAGWSRMIAPAGDDAARDAARAGVIDMIASASARDHVLALISGGASCGPTLAGGVLARSCEAPITTLAISDVVGDDPRAIGGGPTIADRPGDRVEVIARLDSVAQAIDSEIEAGEIGGPHVPTTFEAPMTGTAWEIAHSLVDSMTWVRGVAWGKPDVNAHELALWLARLLRNRERSCALVAATDGRGGAAYVDSTTWDAIEVAGIDPQRALERSDASAALGAVGAHVVTGLTGFDFGLVAIIS